MPATLIIAEAGVNHNGDLQIAKCMVDAAVDAGANIIKFQTFDAKKLVVKSLGLAGYQTSNLPTPQSQYEMLKKLEMSREMHFEIKNYCNYKKIEFCSTAFDIQSVDLLNELNVQRYKIPSGEITNYPLLEKIGGLSKKIIMSTGMANEDEILAALNVLTNSGANLKDITLLHCTSEYPAPMDSINLKAMNSIGKKFNTAVGYSDHSVGIEVSIAAVALGATVIEKHFTLDRKMIGPDHKASIEPIELKKLVDSIRNVEVSLGSEKKEPSKIELNNIRLTRKSIVANKIISKGEPFTYENITTKRAGGGGISPMMIVSVIGRFAPRNFDLDELIEL